MEWDELRRRVSARADVDAVDSDKAMDAFVDVVKEAMLTEDRISLRADFGAFEMRDGGGKGGSNLTKSHRTPVFKKSAELKKNLRQSDEEYLNMLRSEGRGAQAERIERMLSMPQQHKFKRSG